MKLLIVLCLLVGNTAILFDNSICIPSVIKGANGAPGGKVVVNLTKCKYKSFMKRATSAINQLDKSTNSANEHFLIRIDEASSQIVSGIKYEIRFYIGECKAGTYKDAKPKLMDSITDDKESWLVEPLCEENENGQYALCWVVIWDAPWQNKDNEVQKYKCKPVAKSEAYANT